jgi:hypothetical protein
MHQNGGFFTVAGEVEEIGAKVNVIAAPVYIRILV